MPQRPFDDPRLPAVSRRRFGIVLRGLYPGASQELRGRMVGHCVKRVYRGGLIGIAASVTFNWARHTLTPYEDLKYAPDGMALDRKTARQVVAPQVTAIVASWREGGAQADPGYRAMRRRFHRRRLKEGPSPALTKEENVAIVEELTRWLRNRGELVSESKNRKRQASGCAQEDEPRPAGHLMATEQPLHLIERKADSTGASPEGAAPDMSAMTSPIG